MSLTDILLIALAVMIILAIVVYAVAKICEKRNPPIGAFITAGGVRLHYTERGRGEPIVLLHGNATMMQDYLTSGVVEKLADRHRVIVLDRPGFGYSERPRRRVWSADEQAKVVGEALHQLGVEKAIVVGHSWGTLVAIALALRDPDRIAALGLLSGYYYPEVRLDVALVTPVATPVIGDVLRYTLSPLTGLLLLPMTLKAMFAPPAVPHRFKAEFPISLMLRPWQIRAAAEDGALMNLTASLLAPGYSRLHLPVLLMAGAQDQVVDHQRHSERLSREIPGSQLKLLDGAGHMVHHTNCLSVEEAIRQLADRVPAK